MAEAGTTALETTNAEDDSDVKTVSTGTTDGSVTPDHKAAPSVMCWPLSYATSWNFIAGGLGTWLSPTNIRTGTMQITVDFERVSRYLCDGATRLRLFGALDEREPDGVWYDLEFRNHADCERFIEDVLGERCRGAALARERWKAVRIVG
jgi:hypothetical protein